MTRIAGRAAGRVPPSFGVTQIDEAWQAALAVWDVHTELSPPEPLEGKSHSHWSGDDPLAYIDLRTRQVVINLPLLEEIGAAQSLPAVLAHEIGHHVRFPHTLGLIAALQVLELRLIPGLRSSLTNLFFDLQVNEVVGRTRSDELAAVYRGFVRRSDSRVCELFFFYLAIYEELWALEPGSLVPEIMIPQMEQAYAGCRADARVFSQTFYELTSVYLQFIYFCSRFIRYIPSPGKATESFPMAADLPQPDADDLDRAIAGIPGVDAAVDEARERGWIEDSGAVDREAGDPFTVIDRVTQHAPGSGGGELRRALVSKHYQRLIDKYVFELAGDDPAPEPFLPTVPAEWEWGDHPSRIDWTLSVLERGALAGIHPLRRELEPDLPAEAVGELPAVEISLDTSGSMPNPQYQLNAMTLAAQILSASAIRRGGSVRGIIYSSGAPSLSDWMRDEETARAFLLGYIGGGTDYPWEELRKSSEQRPDAIRVIISDSDFLYNVSGGGLRGLEYAAQHSRLLVALLAIPDEKRARQVLQPVLALPRFRLSVVRDLADFAAAAAQLSAAILGR